MSKAFTAPKIIKQITKIDDSPILSPRIRIFKTENKLIQFKNNPNLDPKIRFFTVTKDAPGFPIGGGAWNKNRHVTSEDRLRAKPARFELEKSHQAPYSSSESGKAGDRDLSQSQPQAFLRFKQQASQKDPEPSSDIRAVTDALEARKRERDLRNESRIISNNMSSELTKVLAKDACPPAGPYSQAIKAAGQVWCAGQIPADAQGNLIEGSIAEKTAQCCRNLKAILEAAGSSMDKVVRVGVFITDMANFAEMNGEYEKWFAHKPARTCVAVYQLPKGVPVEIEAIALQ